MVNIKLHYFLLKDLSVRSIWISSFIVLGFLVNVFTLNLFCLEVPVGDQYRLQTPRFAASELGLHCLHMSQKSVSVEKRVIMISVMALGSFPYREIDFQN